MHNHFIRVCDLNSAALFELFERAQQLEAAFHKGDTPQLLQGKRIALSFEDGGFRNRIAFDLGIQLMGGKAVFIPGRPGAKESAADIARYLNNWFDAVVIRTPEFSVVEEMAQNSRIPVINARTRHNHPCEILGDLAFVRKIRGSLDDLRVVFVGEPTNLCHSWFEAGVALPIEVIQVCPPGYEINKSFYENLRGKASGNLVVSHDIETAFRNADVIYTDCWPTRTTPEDVETVSRAFLPFRITSALLDRAPAKCVFLPCPPVTRGEELSDDSMTSSKCRVYEAKDYLLHAQNALLATILG
ncbi:MAG: ornithine carbamoyltransferase [Candidatus Methylacidiphilales bacterium]